MPKSRASWIALGGVAGGQGVVGGVLAFGLGGHVGPFGDAATGIFLAASSSSRTWRTVGDHLGDGPAHGDFLSSIAAEDGGLQGGSRGDAWSIGSTASSATRASRVVSTPRPLASRPRTMAEASRLASASPAAARAWVIVARSPRSAFCAAVEGVEGGACGRRRICR